MLATDEWLRVQGCADVYALGDCATIAQRKVMVCSFYSFFKNIMLLIPKTTSWFGMYVYQNHYSFPSLLVQSDTCV